MAGGGAPRRADRRTPPLRPASDRPLPQLHG
nr:MAG TPA: hypothetical protein [Caudoviricetes sp.]DAM40422.1 MAG TPA: hypothetical protein [Caudoviricetes sp.]